MGKLLLLFAFFVPAGNRWVKLHDSYRVHVYYEDHYGNVIGEYYQPRTGSDDTKPYPFTAQCFVFKPVEFATEADARSYLAACR